MKIKASDPGTECSQERLPSDDFSIAGRRESGYLRRFSAVSSSRRAETKTMSPSGDQAAERESD